MLAAPRHPRQTHRGPASSTRRRLRPGSTFPRLFPVSRPGTSSCDLQHLFDRALAFRDGALPHLRALELRVREPYPAIAGTHDLAWRGLPISAECEVGRTHDICVSPAIRRDCGDVARSV